MRTYEGVTERGQVGEGGRARLILSHGRNRQAEGHRKAWRRIFLDKQKNGEELARKLGRVGRQSEAKPCKNLVQAVPLPGRLSI